MQPFGFPNFSSKIFKVQLAAVRLATNNTNLMAKQGL